MVRYVDAHKHAEEICRQKDFYETLLKTQSDLGEGLLIVEDGHLVYCNEAFCKISGYSMAELATIPTVLDLVVPEVRSALEDRMGRRLCGEAVQEHYEAALRHASGRRVELEIAVRLLRREGRLSQLVVLVRDI